VDEGWDEPETAWWAKHRHAQDHAARLRDVCAEYQATKPLEVRPESTDVPGQTAYRFHQSAPIPVAISLIVGDLVHCLRSALDSLVFGIVSDSLGREMTEDEERACQFPICSSPDTFEAFFTGSRAKIMDDRVRFALNVVQPFYWLQNMKLLSVEGANALSYVDYSRSHPLTSVARLSNIDKHRRLTVAAWKPSLIYWPTRDEDDRGEHHWRSVGSPPWDDGEIIGYMTSTGQGSVQVVHEFNLVITDLTSHLMHESASRDLPEQADEWLAGVDRTLHQMIRDYTQPPAHVDGDQPSTR
jgi:hypothetical protein